MVMKFTIFVVLFFKGNVYFGFDNNYFILFYKYLLKLCLLILFYNIIVIICYIVIFWRIKYFVYFKR